MSKIYVELVMLMKNQQFSKYSKKKSLKKWQKTVTIKTLETEKARKSLILYILVNGEIVTMIVFKGKTDGTLIKKLERHPLVVSKKFLQFFIKILGLILLYF